MDKVIVILIIIALFGVLIGLEVIDEKWK